MLTLLTLGQKCHNFEEIFHRCQWRRFRQNDDNSVSVTPHYYALPPGFYVYPDMIYMYLPKSNVTSDRCKVRLKWRVRIMIDFFVREHHRARFPRYLNYKILSFSMCVSMFLCARYLSSLFSWTSSVIRAWINNCILYKTVGVIIYPVDFC